MGQVLRFDPPAVFRPDFVVRGELDAVSAGGRQLTHVLRSGWKRAFGDVNFMAVEVGDDACGQVDHLVDAPPDPAGCEDARVAGDAGIGRVDATTFRTRVPLVDRVVVLHARVGAA